MRSRTNFIILYLSAVFFIIGSFPRYAEGDLTTDGLILFHPFDDGAGNTSSDTTGNGHDGNLQGGTSWGAGLLALDGGDSTMMNIPDHSDLRYTSFTWDVWLISDGTNHASRILTHAERVGGTGPEIFAYGEIAMRINNNGAVWDPPTVGSRSNDGPPDHFAETEDNIPRGGDTPLHIVVVHDAGARLVRIFFAREGETLKLELEATYSGSFDLSSSGLTMGNAPTGERGFDGRFFQLAVYDRALTADIAGLDVTGGEVFDSHEEGSDAALCIPSDEVCNDVDDDCDGTIDNGDLCPTPGEECIDGVCVPVVEETAEDVVTDAMEAVDASPADVFDVVGEDPADVIADMPVSDVSCVWDDDCPEEQYCEAGRCIDIPPGDDYSGGCSCSIPR